MLPLQCASKIYRIMGQKSLFLGWLKKKNHSKKMLFWIESDIMGAHFLWYSTCTLREREREKGPKALNETVRGLFFPEETWVGNNYWPWDWLLAIAASLTQLSPHFLTSIPHFHQQWGIDKPLIGFFLLWIKECSLFHSHLEHTHTHLHTRSTLEINHWQD